MPTPPQRPDLFGQTPWQTVGPFFHYGLPWKGGADLVGASDLGARADLVPEAHYLLAGPASRGEIAGEIIEIVGRVTDGAGDPLPDALVEIWQADASGRYNTDDPEGFIGFGRAATDDDGAYRFRTLKPGPAPGPDGRAQAPHIAFGISGRGLLKRLVTRLYFGGEADNADDPVLSLVPEPRRQTLMATAVAASAHSWRFDIVLQGEGETVFFDF
ncbi:MAG TPA: protocatechuate 3,4-dioxygenase subunit alpha [Caulobacter sp.]|nr:protocatechuate 3,4-dioxygenase subunit alpha [Caulobacter sp.]